MKRDDKKGKIENICLVCGNKINDCECDFKDEYTEEDDLDA
jgi:hypothetical protein